MSWRALVLSGADPDTTLDAVQRVLRSERSSDETFATVCDLELDAGAEWARLRLAGHMSPLVVGDDDVARRTVGVNARGSNDPERGVALAEVRRRLVDEVAGHGSPEEA